MTQTMKLAEYKYLLVKLKKQNKSIRSEIKKLKLQLTNQDV